jgi:hypothetical protein
MQAKGRAGSAFKGLNFCCGSIALGIPRRLGGGCVDPRYCCCCGGGGGEVAQHVLAPHELDDDAAHVLLPEDDGAVDVHRV